MGSNVDVDTQGACLALPSRPPAPQAPCMHPPEIVRDAGAEVQVVLLHCIHRQLSVRHAGVRRHRQHAVGAFGQAEEAAAVAQAQGVGSGGADQSRACAG